MLLEEAPPPAQPVICIILCYREKKNTLFLPLVRPCPTAVGHCNFVWLGEVSCRLGYREKPETFGSEETIIFLFSLGESSLFGINSILNRICTNLSMLLVLSVMAKLDGILLQALLL